MKNQPEKSFGRGPGVFAVLLIALLAPATAGAQVVLSGGTVHMGDGTVIEGGTVVIRADGKIGAVGKDVAAPANAKLIDVTGKIVTPGFIDPATTLGLVEIWAVDGSRDGDAGPLDNERDPVRAAFRAADGFNPMAVAIPLARAGGVTSVVALPWGGVIAGQAMYAELGGDFGHATVTKESIGQVVTLGASGGQSVGGSRASALLTVREAFDDAKFWAKNQSNFDANRSRSLSVSRLDAAALSEAMESQRFFVAVDRASDILAALKLAREQQIDIVLLGGAEAWLVAKEIAAANVPVVVAPMSNLPSSFDRLGQRADNATLLQKAGVKVVISTFSSHYVGNLRYLAGNAVRAGLPHEQAVVALTKNAAEAAGVDSEVGTLAAQKTANVVVWSGDPFEISTVAEAVYVAGKEVSTKTRQDELFERYRKIPRRGAVAAPPAVPDEGVPDADAKQEDDDVESDD